MSTFLYGIKGVILLNLIIYKNYSNKETAREEMDVNADNNDQTIAYVSGKEDMMSVLKGLIKTVCTS